jgi:hypothetical protein
MAATDLEPGELDIEELIAAARREAWGPLGLSRELADRLEALDKHHTLVCHDREKIWQEREEARAALEAEHAHAMAGWEDAKRNTERINALHAKLEAEHAARREAEAERDALRQVMNGMHLMPIAKYDRLRRVVDAARNFHKSFGAGSEMTVTQSYYLQMLSDELVALDSAEETKP